jgi:hypothetical protein
VLATLSIQVGYLKDTLKGNIMLASLKRYKSSCSKDVLKGNIVLTASSKNACLQAA